MALTFAQQTAGTAAAPLVTVPPGPCTVVITVGTQAVPATLYVGTSSAVTAGSGMAVTTGAPLTITQYPASAAQALWAVASAAATPVGVMISRPDK